MSARVARISLGTLLAAVAVLGACDGFTISITFVEPKRAQSSETQNVALPDGAGVIVNNDNGSTRVTVDPNATQAAIEIIRIALAQTQEEADALLAQIVVTVQTPDADNPDLRITATRPEGTTGSTSEFEFELEDDELNITGIRSNRKVAIVRLRISLPPGHAVQVSQTNGPIRVAGLDRNSSLTTTNGSIKSITCNADLTLQTTNGAIDVEEHDGSLIATAQNGALDLDVADLAANQMIDAQTQNGSLRLRLPANVDANLTADTSNGRVRLRAEDFNSVSDASISPRSVRAKLNDGGAMVDLDTTNGNITIEGR